MLECPDLSDAILMLEEALGMIQYLSLHACGNERFELEQTAARIVRHLAVLRDSVHS